MKYMSLLLSGSALMLASTAANAQDNWPNWYVGLKGAVPFVSDQNVSRSGVSSGEMDFDDGAMYSGALGYMPNGSKFRLEAEFFNAKNNLSGARDIVVGALDGDITVEAIMFNAFYDLQNTTLLTPYFGAGLGGARVTLESNGLGISTADDDTQMAYQLMTGMAYEPKMLRNVAFSLGYRYFSTFDEVEFGGGASQTSLEYDSHNVELGAQFRF